MRGKGGKKTIMSAFIPKENRILTALEKGETPLGMQMFTHDPDLIEIVGYTGFDFVMIDMEHSRVNPETMVNCIRAAEASGLSPLIRVAENNPSLIRYSIEAGAQGVIVPLVNTAEEAKKAVTAVKYPPEGIRGFAFCRANDWGVIFDEYAKNANRDIVVVVMIESKEAVENIQDAIKGYIESLKKHNESMSPL